MFRTHARTLTIIAALFLALCTSACGEKKAEGTAGAETQQAEEPKTEAGKLIKRAKGTSKSLEKRNSQLNEQIDKESK